MIGMRNAIEFIPLMFIVPSFFAASDLKKFTNIMLSLSLIVALLGLIQLLFFYMGFVFMFNEMGSGIAIARIYSTLFNPNNLGIYLVTFLLLFFGLYVNNVYLINKIFSRLSMILLAVCLFFTFSRGALLALMLGVIFLLFRKKYYRSIMLSFIAGLLIIFAVTIYNPGILFRYVRAFSSEGGKNEIAYRLISIPQKGWEQMSNKPLSIITGITPEDWANGPDSLEFKKDNYTTGNEKWSGQGISMDNYYVLLFFTSGLVPFITFIVLIYLLFKESNLTASLTRDPFYSGLIAGILSVFISYIVLGFVTDLWNLFPSNFYFWFLAGMLVLINKVVKQERAQYENRD
ncbi:MAG: O-antigen ligase family protein [Desulfotomaculaceae bacterium]